MKCGQVSRTRDPKPISRSSRLLASLWVTLIHFWMITMWMDLEFSNKHGALAAGCKARVIANRCTMQSTCNIFMRFALRGILQAFNRIYRTNLNNKKPKLQEQTYLANKSAARMGWQDVWRRRARQRIITNSHQIQLVTARQWDGRCSHCLHYNNTVENEAIGRRCAHVICMRALHSSEMSNHRRHKIT